MQLETTDLFRCAFLLCSGGKLVKVYLSDQDRGTVSFLISGRNLEHQDYAYRTGRAKVNPLKLKESLNLLRDMLFKTKREQERGKNGHHQRRDRIYKTG